jgi:hypothetical protein
MLSFWPGYCGIVQYGRWSFLVIALLFALMFDAFLVADFYWTAVITSGQRNILLGVFSAVWIGLIFVSSVKCRSLEAMLKTDEKDSVFCEAVSLYLRGDWFGTESLILPLLRKNPQDIEILLLQATLYRHTKRYGEASKVLDKLDLLENSRRWFLEIETERQFIAAEMKES